MLSRLRSTTASTAAPTLNRLRLRLLQFTLRRHYVSTAQPQLDPDYCYQSEMEQNADLPSLLPVTDTESSEIRRGVQWAFIGNPRAKKHVYAEMLSNLLQVPHISMASLVRQDLSPRSSLYRKIANAVNRGEIVSEDIILGLLSKRLKDGYYRGEIGFILDGIPRTRIQAEILDQLAEIDLVVNFKCTEEFVVKSQAGGSWSQKLQGYAEQNKLLEDYYRKQRKLLDFQVSSAPYETWQGLLSVLNLEHINTAHSSQKGITDSNIH